jgi:hypothetical protein
MYIVYKKNTYYACLLFFLFLLLFLSRRISGPILFYANVRHGLESTVFHDASGIHAAARESWRDGKGFLRFF